MNLQLQEAQILLLVMSQFALPNDELSTSSFQSLLETTDIEIAANIDQITETDIVPHILPPDLQEEINIQLHRVN